MFRLAYVSRPTHTGARAHRDQGKTDRPMAAHSEFARVVRDAMDREDLSLSALARESGVDRSRWYAWFRGENTPQSRTLVRAAKVLGVDVQDLTAPWGGLRSPELITDSGLTALVTAIGDLVDLLRPSVEDHEIRIRAVEAELRSLRERQEDGESPKRSAPQRSKG